MKIDLHIHTIGDAQRNISNDNLLDKLNKENVKLASITDHNIFDEEKFIALSKNISGIKFIPGIEVDVIFQNKEIKHFTVLSEKTSFIQEFENNTNGISWEVFKQKLERTRRIVLVSAHFMKHDNRSFVDINVLKNYFDEINSSFVKKMIDLPSINKTIDVQAHLQRKYHAASFSDVRNWAEYHVVSQKLPDTSLNINSLDAYITNFVDTSYQFGMDIDASGKTYRFNLKKENREIEIELPRGLNVVFGQKGSGKSEFINSFQQSNSHEFQKLDFQNLETKNLMELYKQLKKDEVISKQQSSSLSKFANLLNRQLYTSTISKAERINSFSTFYKNLKKSTNWNRLQIITDENEYLKKTYSDTNGMQHSKIDDFIKINNNLFEILDVISKETYTGSLDKETIHCLIYKNINDWHNTIKINHFSLKNRVLDDLKMALKLDNEPKLMLNQIVLSYVKNVGLKNAFISSFNEITESISESDTLFSTNILGDSYSFKTKFTIRKNDASSSDDFDEISAPNNFNEKLAKIKLLFENTKNINELLDFNLNFDSFKAGDIFNIDFISSFLSDDAYIPSTGQYDMMKLDHFLKMGKNLVIDEFCNSLDNEYVFRYLVNKMNNYGGTILATTHNPIICVIPRVGKYIYRERRGHNYLTFESENSIDGNLISQEGFSLNAKDQIVKTIEGTMDAFDQRKEKYEFKEHSN